MNLRLSAMTLFRHISLVVLLLVCGSPLPAGAQTDASPRYDFDAFGALEAEIARVDGLRAQTAEGSEERRALTGQAIEARAETRAFLRGWIDSGELQSEYLDYARQADLVLAENLVHLHVELEECATADAMLQELHSLSDNDSEALRTAYLSAVLAVEECDQRDLLIADAPVMPTRHRVHPAAASLVGVGAVLAVSGAVWNLTLLDDRTQHRELRAACLFAGGCDAPRVNALGQRLRSAQAPVAVLFVGGVAMAASGAAWWAVDQRQQRRDQRVGVARRARVTPSVDLGPGRARASVHVVFGGRR